MEHSQQPKRLLFLTPIFPKDESDDNVVPFIHQFTHLYAETKNVKIDVLSLMYPFSKKPYFISGISVHPIGGNFKKSFRQIIMLFRAVVKGIQLLNRNKYDGILCFWYRETALVGKILSLMYRKKQIIWLQGQDIKKDNIYIKLLQIPASQLVFVSKQQREEFKKNHSIPVKKIANVAVSKHLFPELNEHNRTLTILGVGNLGALKNYSLFLDIVSQLDQKCKALIIGGGDEMNTLKEKVNQLGLAKNIEFTGFIAHAEVLKYMNNSQIFLHTSKFEGAGTVLQEALYSGCKVVSTIPIEINSDTDAFYYSTEKSQLVTKINSLLKNPLVHYRVEHFKMQDSIQQIDDCFYKD